MGKVIIVKNSDVKGISEDKLPYSDQFNQIVEKSDRMVGLHPENFKSFIFSFKNKIKNVLFNLWFRLYLRSFRKTPMLYMIIFLKRLEIRKVFIDKGFRKSLEYVEDYLKKMKDKIENQYLELKSQRNQNEDEK